MAKTDSRRVVFPLTQWQRDLLIEIVDVLESKGLGERAERVIQELLNFLPEVQFGPDRFEYRHHKYLWRELKRKPPSRPLIEVIDDAEQFDDRNHDILRLRVKYDLGLAIGKGYVA